MDKAVNRLTIHVDGASRGNPGPAAIGVVIKDDRGTTELKISCYIGEATNNQAEYKALIMGLQEASKLKADHIDIKTDSNLMVEQIRGRYKVLNAGLRPLFEEVNRLLAIYKTHSITHIPRHQNKAADALANEALDKIRTH